MVKTCARGYWPIGSAYDYDVLLELRAHADALIHGKTTAMWFRTLDSLQKKEFRARRISLGKSEYLPYFVVSNHPDDRLVDYLENAHGNTPNLITTEQASVSSKLRKSALLKRFGKTSVDLKAFSKGLFLKGYKSVLIEGGPTLLGSFLGNNLVDEVFLTVAPKIFGNIHNSTLTMVEGTLLPHTKIKRCQLLSVQTIHNEIFLRYKII